MAKKCPDCDGVGSHDPGYQNCGGGECRTCKGEGRVSDFGTPLVDYAVCTNCFGAKCFIVPCLECNAKGIIRVTVPEISTEDLIRKLEEVGSTGLDMSPGDPLAAAAAKRLRELSK